jgi:peroxiredoxin
MTQLTPPPPRAPFLGCALLVAALAGLTALFVLQSSRGARLRPLAAQQAPAFDLPDLEAHRVSLSSLRGRPVLVNFWATWCAPCRAELPELEALFRERPCGLAVLGISVDSGSDASVAGFAREHGVTYPVLFDDGSAGAAYQVVTLPHSVLVDAEGREVGLFRGPVTAKGVREALRC